MAGRQSHPLSRTASGAKRKTRSRRGRPPLRGHKRSGKGAGRPRPGGIVKIPRLGGRARAPRAVPARLGGHLLVGESALELFEVRRLLEGAAAALAAARIDPAGKEELGQKLEKMMESRTVEELVEADVAFHAVIARATGNTFLTSLLASLSSRTLRARMWRAREVDNAFDVTRDEHRRIVEAIVAGDPELARAAAMAHIASGQRWLRAQLASAAVEPPQAPAEVGG